MTSHSFQRQTILGPNGEEIMASISSEINLPYYFLLNSSGFNTPEMSQLFIRNKTNGKHKDRKEQSALMLFQKPKTLINKTLMSFHAEDDKILYIASRSAGFL
jgi:hypothetical protein